MGGLAGEILGGQQGKGYKAQTTLPLYYGWVIQQLVHTWGKSEAEVLRTIVDRWMAEHQAELRELDLWPPQVRAARPTIVPPRA